MSAAAAAIAPRRRIAEITHDEITRATRRRDELVDELTILDASIALMRSIQQQVGITTDSTPDPEVADAHR